MFERVIYASPHSLWALGSVHGMNCDRQRQQQATWRMIHAKASILLWYDTFNATTGWNEGTYIKR